MTTHMLQEIGEAGDAVARQLGHNAEQLAELGPRLRALDPPLVATIARGSSDCCALYLKYLVEIALGVPCASIGPSIATLYRAPIRLKGAVSVAISQSGRSPDIVEMQRAARRGGALTVALINDVASLLAGEAEVLLPLCAGRGTFRRRDQIDGCRSRRGREPGRGLARGSAARRRPRRPAGRLARANGAAARGGAGEARKRPQRFRTRPRRDACDRRRGGAS